MTERDISKNSNGPPFDQKMSALKKVFLITILITGTHFLPGQDLKIETRLAYMGGEESAVVQTVRDPNHSLLRNNHLSGTCFTCTQHSGNSLKVYPYSNFLVGGNDSLNNARKWYKTDTGISLLVSGGFFGMAALTFKDEGTFSRKKVRDEINRFLPNYENTVDDFTQYIPYIATYAFDAFGVKSRHKLLRKTTTMATALVLNGAVTGTMKSVIDEERPDGSANNSFPSGHTTTAFMGAHIFHKEYRHISPYYSVAAYALASFTGVFRQLNNRHWVSDVMMGAGLGISLTELAYFINEKIYKDQGVNPQKEYQQQINERHPSFLSATIGFASLTDKFNNEATGLSSQKGYVISTEFAYFFTKYIGIGGAIQGQSFPIEYSQEAQREINNEGYELVFQTLGSTNVLAGPFFQYPLGKNLLGTKFLMGSLSGSDTELTLRVMGSTDLTSENEILYADFSPNTTFAWSTGWYYKRLISKITALGVYGHYTNSDLEFDQKIVDNWQDGEPIYVKGERLTKNFNSYSIGLSLSVMLW